MSADFEKMREHCLHHKKIADKVLDQFLLKLMARKEGMDQKMNSCEKTYHHLLGKLPRGFLPMAMGEYIIGKTLTPDGLIHKYLNHAQMRSLDGAEREFLEFHAGNPWRYCFAWIAERKEKDFFILRDAFFEDEFLIYSPGIEDYWTKGRKQDLYFLLTGFNGQCFHTYGLILPFRSFEPDDIYFYGSEIDPEVNSDNSLMASVYKDPIPYMMLACGMEYPVVKGGDHTLRHRVAVDEVAGIDTDKLKEFFSVQWNANVYRISQKDWRGSPHFASAYYNESTGELSRYALTGEGFRELTRMLNQAGLHIEEEQDYTLGLTMLMTMKQILKKELNLNEYEKLFPDKEIDPPEQKELDKINHFLSLLLPYFNTGKQPDLDLLARQSGIVPESARELYHQLKIKFGK